MNLSLLKKILVMPRDLANLNEQSNAKRLLEAALEKEGITFEEFLEKVEEKEMVWVQLKGKNACEREFLGQISAFVCGTYHLRHRRTGQGTGIRVRVPVDKVEELKDFSQQLILAWRAEMEMMETAFIHKHKLYVPSDPDEEQKPCTLMPDEIDKLRAMMQGMDDVEYRKKLGE